MDESIAVAAKSLKSGTNESIDAKQSFVMEALRMKDLNHPNVMNLIGICWSSDQEHERYSDPLVILPYMMLGDPKTYLREERYKRLRFSEKEKSLNRHCFGKTQVPTVTVIFLVTYFVSL
eukprot:m.193042 g.193042  ORF g.193042 m.193042 type:complete len:120 (+) comp39476_c0_seq8:1634-1993(+)